MKKVIGFSAGFLSLVSIVFLIAAFSDLVTGDTETDTGILIGLLVFFIGIALASGYVAYSKLGADRKQKLSPEERERTLLQLAKQNKGILTIAQVATESELTIKESKEQLESLSLAGVCEVGFDEEGAVMYTFKGLG